jgi:hypothetical protein
MSGTIQIVARGEGRGANPLCISALSSGLVLVQATLAVPPLGVGLYGAWYYNPGTALAYVQHFDPPVVGSLAAKASLATPGAQTGVVVTLITGTLANTNTLIIDTGDSSEVVTISALTGTNPYTVSFTSALAHQITGSIPVARGITLGTTVRKLALPVPSFNLIPIQMSSLGIGFKNGIVLAATTTATGSTAPATALVVNTAAY